MDVFLIPIAPDRYEPYCEPTEAEAAPPDADPPARGLVRRMWGRFQHMLKAAEHEQRKPESERARPTLSGRIMRWVAERIAEQRLLWHLRRQDHATLHYPSDLTAEQARALFRDQLRRDAERHRRWMIIDTVLTMITGPLFFFVPGPNVVAYYFLFRAVGHYLSQKGARHGLDLVGWTHVANDPLVDLRRAIELEDPHRSEYVHHVAARLQLHHLPLFVSRVALKGA